MLFLQTNEVGVEVAFVAPSWMAGQPAVVLQDTVGDRILPIFIGQNEARAIQFALDGIDLPRPMTHDLMVKVMESLGGRLDKVVVTDLNKGTYYAEVHLKKRDGKEKVVDSRPSDAIALALRVDAPIFVMDQVFEKEEKAREKSPQLPKSEEKKPKVGDI